MSNGTASVAILVIILFYGFIIFMDMAKFFFRKPDFEIDEEEEQQQQLKIKKKSSRNKYFEPKVKRINVLPKQRQLRFYSSKF